MQTQNTDALRNAYELGVGGKEVCHRKDTRPKRDKAGGGSGGGGRSGAKTLAQQAGRQGEEGGNRLAIGIPTCAAGSS